jgi:hypothetical protein
MSDRQQGGAYQPGSQGRGAEPLRQTIDAGQTGDKVAASDPATSPLGTDDEAAGSRPHTGAPSRETTTTGGMGMSESPTGGGTSGGASGAGSLAGTSGGGRAATPGAASSSTQSARLDARPRTRNWWIIVAAFVVVLLVVLYAFGVTWPTAGFRN